MSICKLFNMSLIIFYNVSRRVPFPMLNKFYLNAITYITDYIA